MAKTYKKARRFSKILVFIVLAGAIFASLVAAFILQSSSQRGQSDEQLTKSKDNTPKNPPVTDSYSGWQSYCSISGGLCVKYPTDWQKAESADSSGLVQVTITSPSNSVKVNYNPSVVGVGGVCGDGTCFFTAKTIIPFAAAGMSNMEIVKGVYENTASGAFLAQYFIGSKDRLSANNLAVDKRADVGLFGAYLTSPINSSLLEELTVKSNPDSGFQSMADAVRWLSLPEVVTGGDILSSVTIK